MSTPDHIGADPALGVGAGQTRRGTPADLAREVLAGGDESDDRFLDFFEARSTAQALARAAIRMEALAEMLERESSILRDRGDYPNESGAIAARIRAVLNGETR